MHEAALAYAARPAQCVCLRLPLRPFSLGHFLLLVRDGNPLVLLGQSEFDLLPENERREALIGAVLTCNRDWRTNQKPHRWLRLWARFIRHCDFARSTEVFRDYLAEGSKDFPSQLPRGCDGDATYIGAPEVLRVYQHLCRTLPPAELYAYGKSAWDYPYSLGKMHLTASLEGEGKLAIYNYRDAVHDQFVDEMMAEEQGKEQNDAQPA